MLEDNRYEVLDVTTRESSRYIGMAFRDMPVHGSLIGAIVRKWPLMAGGISAQRFHFQDQRTELG